MQSVEDYRRDVKAIKDRVDDLVRVRPRASDLQSKKREADLLAREIQQRLGPLQERLASDGKFGSPRVDLDEECRRRSERWNQLLQVLDVYVEKCDNYQKKIDEEVRPNECE